MSIRREMLQPTGERYDFNALALATRDTLEETMRLGVRPDMDALVGWEFKVYTVLEPSELFSLRKFKKGFYLEDPTRDPGLGINGYTVKVHSNTLGEPWIDRTRMGNPRRSLWFDVYPVSLTEIDNKYPNALLLNYGLSPKNGLLEPGRMLRDYVVQVYEDNTDLLLGKSFMALGNMRVPLTFTVLERHNESNL